MTSSLSSMVTETRGMSCREVMGWGFAPDWTVCPTSCIVHDVVVDPSFVSQETAGWLNRT